MCNLHSHRSYDKIPADARDKDVQGHLALAGIRVSLPLEVPSDMAALHEFVRDSAHRADNDFLALEGGSKA